MSAAELPLPEAPAKLTEARVFALLRDRFDNPGNGGSGSHALLGQVRNAAGFDATRTFDAVSVDLWPSRGFALHVYEIKVSRSDWLRELKEPSKAEAAFAIADHFSVVAPSGCVKAGELPDGWGLIEVTGNGDNKPWRLRTTKAAPKTHKAATKTKPIDRSFLVALLRSSPGAVPGGRVPSPADEVLRAEYARGVEVGVRQGKAEAARPHRETEEAAKGARQLTEALMAAGVDRWTAEPWALAHKAEQIAAALKGADVKRELDQARRVLQMALDALTPEPTT